MPATRSRLIAVACLAGCGVSAGWTSPSAAAPRIVNLSLSGQSQRVPPSFLGLSFEYTELPGYESSGRVFDRMLALLRTPNGMPTLVRLGGRSADEVYWDTPTTSFPRWLTELQPAWLQQLASLVRRDHLRVELAVNLAVHSPRMAAAFVQAAVRALPRGRLAGLAIGNEPDLYKLQPQLQDERIASTVTSTPARWTDHYAPSRYRRDYRDYARSLERVAPGVPITAPDVTFPNVQWPSAVVGLGRLAPRTISIHRYATAYCKRIHYRGRPTVSTFLEERLTSGLAGTLHVDIALAQAHRLALRVTEMNSVTCGGQDGVANSFATALWAPDALFEMMKVGVVGINWHIRPKLPNAPFQLTSKGVDPMPEMYGLALFARMIGPGARLERVSLAKPAGLQLKAWAVQSTTGLELLLIDKSARAVSARLRLPGAHTAALVSRLLAPKLSSERGVTLAGQAIGADGRWQGRRVRTVVSTSERHLPDRRAALQRRAGRSRPLGSGGGARLGARHTRETASNSLPAWSSFPGWSWESCSSWAAAWGWWAAGCGASWWSRDASSWAPARACARWASRRAPPWWSLAPPPPSRWWSPAWDGAPCVACGAGSCEDWSWWSTASRCSWTPRPTASSSSARSLHRSRRRPRQP